MAKATEKTAGGRNVQFTTNAILGQQLEKHDNLTVTGCNEGRGGADIC